MEKKHGGRFERSSFQHSHVFLEENSFKKRITSPFNTGKVPSRTSKYEYAKKH